MERAKLQIWTTFPDTANGKSETAAGLRNFARNETGSVKGTTTNSVSSSNEMERESLSLLAAHFLLRGVCLLADRQIMFMGERRVVHSKASAVWEINQ